MIQRFWQMHLPKPKVWNEPLQASESMSMHTKRNICALIKQVTFPNCSTLKLVDKFTYLGISVSSTETDVNVRLAKAWMAIDTLSIIWKSDLTDKMKRSFFQAAIVSIPLHGCTTWTLTKRMEKKLDGNYTRMLRAILNKSWRQNPTKQQLYGHQPPITKTIKVRRTRHTGHCWKSRDELISEVLLWTPSHGRAKAGRPAQTYSQQLCPHTGCSPEDLPKAVDDREVWRERAKNIRADSATWWWWYYNKIYQWSNHSDDCYIFCGYRTLKSFVSRPKFGNYLFSKIRFGYDR